VLAHRLLSHSIFCLLSGVWVYFFSTSPTRSGYRPPITLRCYFGGKLEETEKSVSPQQLPNMTHSAHQTCRICPTFAPGINANRHSKNPLSLKPTLGWPQTEDLDYCFQPRAAIHPSIKGNPWMSAAKPRSHFCPTTRWKNHKKVEGLSRSDEARHTCCVCTVSVCRCGFNLDPPFNLRQAGATETSNLTWAKTSQRLVG
jgi:hypothetical protein